MADLLLALVGAHQGLGAPWFERPWWAVRPSAYSFRRHAKRFSGGTIEADVKTKALLAAASLGTKLESLDLSQWDDDMQMAPTTASEAWYRVAYWTAAAAQIANAKRPEIANSLILSAGKALATAEATFVTSPFTSWLVDPSKVESIRAIVLGAYATLGSVGEPQLLLLLQRISVPQAIVARQHELVASSLGLSTLSEAAAKAQGYLEVPVSYVKGAMTQFVDAGRAATTAEMGKAKEVVKAFDAIALWVTELDKTLSRRPPIEVPASVQSTLRSAKGFLATFAQPVAVLREGLGLPTGGKGSGRGSPARFGVAGVDDAVVIVVVVGIEAVALATAAIVLAATAAYSYTLYHETEKAYYDIQKLLAECVASPSSTPEQRAACLKESKRVKAPEAPDPFAGLADLAPWVVGGGLGLAGLWLAGPMIKEVASTGASALESYRLKGAR